MRGSISTSRSRSTTHRSRPVCDALFVGPEAAELEIAELQLGETGIERALLEQLLVRADRDDTARVHDDDAIRAPHGREAMRDHDRRAVLHPARERLLAGPLARRSERARRVVRR